MNKQFEHPITDEVLKSGCVAVQERQHHPYSPSTIGNLEACACYISRQDAKPHERATAGTRAHNVVETGDDDNRLDDDDAIAAADCLDFLARRRQLMEEARDRALDGYRQARAGLPPEILELKEVYLAVDDKHFIEDRFVEKEINNAKVGVHEQAFITATTAGYVDRVLIDHTRTYAEMLDWKFGRWGVEKAETNPQGIAYMLGLFREYPTLQKIHVWFKQPHIDVISGAVFTRDQIPELYLRIQVIVARAREARARLVRNPLDFEMATPTIPACNFCGNLGRCTKVAAIACKVGSKFYPLEIPDNITPTMVLTARDTSLAMRLSQVLSVWAGAFRTQTTDRVLRGDADIPAGFSLEQRQKREVIDERKFKEVALRYLTEEEYKSICPVPGFGDTENIVKEKAPRGSKKAAVEDFQKELIADGAVSKGDPYCFLKATPSEKTETQNT